MTEPTGYEIIRVQAYLKQKNEEKNKKYQVKKLQRRREESSRLKDALEGTIIIQAIPCFDDLFTDLTGLTLELSSKVRVTITSWYENELDIEITPMEEGSV